MYRFSVLVSAFVLATALAACSGGDDTADTADETAAQGDLAQDSRPSDGTVTGDALDEQTGQSEAAQTETSVETLMAKEDPVGVYGTLPNRDVVIPIAAILEDPEPYEGRRVVVVGQIDAVCPMAGCWLDLAAGGETIRVKVDDGVIVFPQSAVGHHAVVTGVVEKVELDEAEAGIHLKHEAEEEGRAFDASSVTGPIIIWRLRGLGAEIEG